MPFNIDREALERLIQESEEAPPPRCPDCGCCLGVGGYDCGYGDYQMVEYCQGQCGYEGKL